MPSCRASRVLVSEHWIWIFWDLSWIFLIMWNTTMRSPIIRNTVIKGKIMRNIIKYTRIKWTYHSIITGWSELICCNVYGKELKTNASPVMIIGFYNIRWFNFGQLCWYFFTYFFVFSSVQQGTTTTYFLDRTQISDALLDSWLPTLLVRS